MSLTPLFNPRFQQQWLAQNLKPEHVKEKLTALGIPEEDAKLYLQEYARKLIEKRQHIGFVYLAVGALIGFLSCALTMLNIVPSLNGFFLYGFSCMAILLILYGLYFIFE